MGNIFEKPKKPKQMKEKSKSKQKKSIKHKSVKRKTKKIGGEVTSNNPKVNELYQEMLKHQDGWNILSKRKPIATLNSGDPLYFINRYKTFNEEEKRELKRCISEFLYEQNGYHSDVEILFTNPNSANYRNIRTCFYIPEYFAIACELIGCTFDEGIELIRYGSRNNSRKTQFIHLVFGDYYKIYFKDQAIECPGFMDLLRRYNAEVGLPDPDSLPMYNKDY